MPKEFWDLKTSDSRSAESLKTFIIFCEDEHHEPLYFKSFEQEKEGIKINAISNLRSKKLNLNATIQFGLEKELIVFNEGSYHVMPGVTDQLWCVYDRDLESETWADIPMQNHIDFDTAVITAEKAGLRVAWSNDVFEMWILLHFEQIPVGQILHRKYIYERLTVLFKHILPRNKELDDITSLDTFNYKANMKRRERFINQVIPLLHPRTQTAITNAKILETEFATNVPYHLRNPCTMVHYLVQEILL
jgi:hypothetical protein